MSNAWWAYDVRSMVNGYGWLWYAIVWGTLRPHRAFRAGLSSVQLPRGWKQSSTRWVFLNFFSFIRSWRCYLVFCCYFIIIVPLTISLLEVVYCSKLWWFLNQIWCKHVQSCSSGFELCYDLALNHAGTILNHQQKKSPEMTKLFEPTGTRPRLILAEFLSSGRQASECLPKRFPKYS